MIHLIPRLKLLRAIVDKGGDYVATLKGNQHNFFDDLKIAFDDSYFYKEVYEDCHYEETEKAHGQIEKGTYIMTEDINWLSNKVKWANLKTIGL